MATPSSKKAAAGKPSAKTVRTSAARRTGATAPDAVGAAPRKGETLLRAGLKVLGEARERQTRVVETLLGIPAAGVTARAGLPTARATLDSIGDSLGFRKLEDVFDQRIAAALERLGIPSAEEFAALREEVRLLHAERSTGKPDAVPVATRRRRR